MPSTAVPHAAKAPGEAREVDGFAGATGRIGPRVEEQHQLLAGEVGERDRAAAIPGESERRRFSPFDQGWRLFARRTSLS